MQSNRSGWTVVELLVAIVIIGILVSFAVPAYMRSIERSKCSQAMSNLRTIRQAELAYFVARQGYTSDWSLLGTIAGANLGPLGGPCSLDNNQWTYSLVAASDTFTAQADRLGGRNVGTVITLNELDDWAGAYPIDNP